MQNKDPLLLLRDNYQAFRDRIISLSVHDFLAPMYGWSPRDVVAHLIGWNRHMIQACSSILVNEEPAYYADAPNNFSNINAAFVREYPSMSKLELLSQLETSLEELVDFLLALDLDELTARHEVIHYTRSTGNRRWNNCLPGRRLQGAC